ncbi:DUF3667 domain-containing protein [Pseudoxanthomonas sp. SL93]|uniref:DUF3667 domain-containing protein n=1 Tax=Pseudoxanthomonas sp. SL93 TaxID=2995142 RepID=UPI002271BF16|nr:DUF3667 domain-containing protein [Pseudoxanthomonas sp. SL93]WAC62757.1 DUF3667 domain-containing protein [Pseudoxanthomonas sp. SL93]
MTPTADPAHASACDNCHTVLQGGFCHQCGQNAHNPLRSFGHAVEEVFESFWHLDGRIFRTLRTLMSPGRLANAYLAGHRAPYVAPLRLFVIISVLTFFVAKFTVHLGELPTPPPVPAKADGTAQTNLVAEPNDGGVDFRPLTTVDDVIRLRDKTLADLLSAHASVPGALGFVRAPIERNIYATQRRARERIAELQPGHPALAQPDRYIEGQPLPSEVDGSLFSHKGKPFHPTDNPVRIGWWPDFANRWLNKKIARAEKNIPRLQSDGEHFKNVLIGSIPSALFVLVPVFALLLKIFYVETRRVYLEHLVVALYSHAYLCLCVLVICILSALNALIPETQSLARLPMTLMQMLICAWMPVYLFWMQQRVYRQLWIITLVKYTLLGTLYFMMLVSAIVFLVFSTFMNA